MDAKMKSKIVAWADRLVLHIEKVQELWGHHDELGFSTCGDFDAYSYGVHVYDNSLDFVEEHRYDSLRTLAEALDIPESKIKNEITSTGSKKEYFYYKGIRFYQLPNKEE